MAVTFVEHVRKTIEADLKYKDGSLSKTHINTLLQTAFIDPFVPEAVISLIIHGAKIGERGVRTAIAQESIEILQTLVSHGYDIDTDISLRGSWLHHALGSNVLRWDAVKWLLERGADVNGDTGFRSESYLFQAVRSGSVVKTRLLLLHGARMEDGLVTAALNMWQGAEEMLQLLLEYGADINEVNPEKSVYGAPLHHVAGFMMQRHPAQLIPLLLKYGADPYVRNDRNQTPLDVAIWSGNKVARQLLKREMRIREGWVKTIEEVDIEETMGYFATLEDPGD